LVGIKQAGLQEIYFGGDDPLLASTGVAGVYGRSGAFERVVGGLFRALARLRPGGAEVRDFPPVMSRAHLEACGYARQFPHLAAAVHTLMPVEEEGRQDHTASGQATDLVLTPAACYPLYPLLGKRGAIPQAGVIFDTRCYCFRREPSERADRLQAFRMQEFVCVGPERVALTFRNLWIPKMQSFADSLGLESSLVPAKDPFFGRMAPYLAQSQLDQGLKFELVCPVASARHETAVFSFNYHQDHFGLAWGLRDTQGITSHSACVGTGIDRLAMALFRAHGPEVGRWPAFVVRALGLN
jgi:seryl-tRNA synthetase